MDRLRVRLMLLAAVALLPLAGLVSYIAFSRRAEAATRAKEDALRLVLVCTDNEERTIDAASQILTVMAQVPGVRHLDGKSCGPLFASTLGSEQGYENIGLLAADGSAIASAKPELLAAPLSSRSFFKRVVAQGEFAVSDYEFEPGTHTAEMICGAPVRDDGGKIAGVVYVELGLKWMGELNLRLNLRPGMTVGIVNPDGTVMMRIPDPQDFVGKSVLNAAAGRMMLSHGGSGTDDLEGLDHVRRLFAYTPFDPVHGLGSFVSAGIPDDIAFRDARTAEVQLLAMLAIFALATFLAAWFAADFLVLRGVRALLRATKKVGAGELGTRAGQVPGGSEFRELANAFDAMAASLEQHDRKQATAAQELEARVGQRTAELGEANQKLQAEIGIRSHIQAEMGIANERLDLALRGATDGIWDWDLVSGHMYFSPRWKEMLGYTDAEVGDRFKEWETRLHPEDRDRALLAFRDYFARKAPVFELEHRLRRKDGTYRWILSRGVAVWDEAGKPKRMAGSHVDLTDRRSAEQALRESESKLRAFLNNVPAILFSIDRTGIITMADGHGMEAIPFVEGGIVGRSVAELYGDIPGIVESVKRALAGESLVITTQLQNLYYEVAFSPVYGRDGIVTGVIGVAHDISARIRAKQELEATALELRRSNEELEQFAYIASHDLQEPLRMVASYTQLLERRYAAQLDDSAREFIGYAVDGAKRMQQFITGLLQYSRVGTERRVLTEVNLCEAYEVAFSNLRIAIEEKHAVVEEHDLPVVCGDARQLAQLLQNLIGNALKFTKPDVPPRVEVWGERDGGFWKISVRDNGIGLDPKFSSRVFTIFQRLHTREEYEGTGLGLAICKKIVERHGGRIWIESREGEGATFSFTLPAADPEKDDNAQA